jgi:glycosyltransferase involved in cell wall biosynthesis
MPSPPTSISPIWFTTVYLGLGNLLLSRDESAEPPRVKPAIVIPVLNEAEYIGVTVQSALSQDIPVDVFVIDGGSSDGTVEVAESYGVRVLNVPGSKLKARDWAYRNLPYEVQLHTDGDVLLPPNWARVMSSHFNDPSVVAVAGTTDLGFLSLAFWPLYMFHYGLRISGRSNAVRRSAYVRSGGFGKMEFETGESHIIEEEVRLYDRLARLGKIVLETRVPVVHLRWDGHFPNHVRERG